MSTHGELFMSNQHHISTKEFMVLKLTSVIWDIFPVVPKVGAERSQWGNVNLEQLRN